MLTVIRGADVYAPEALGPKDIVVGAGRILGVLPAGSKLQGLAVEVVELEGLRLIPGLIDCHVHVTGGGGESGPQSRVPPLALTALTRAGVTSCVGVLGTDGTTRTVRSLVARTLGLRAEGLNAWCYTGSYALPVQTITGSVRDDIAFIDPILGVGELAISDHRSSQPTFDEFLRVASDCHVGGLMTGKAGLLHLHLGDGPRGLALIRRALDEAEIPARVYHPTHVNRQKRLFDEAMALAARGCTVDVTAFDVSGDDHALSAADAIERWHKDGLPLDRLTVSSDGGGCLPTFNMDGVVVEMDVGRPETLAACLATLLSRGHALAEVLPPFTSNVARLFRLHDHGRIEAGKSADLVAIDTQGRVRDVMSRGTWMVRAGVAVVPDTFQSRTRESA